MATSYTSILKLALPATGELAGTWGDVVNQNITSMIEEAIAGLAVVDTWSGASATLTVVNGTTSQSRAAILELGGAPGAAATVICPDATKIYIVRNGVSGGFAATIKTSAGTGVTIPNGKVAAVYCDGVNVKAATEFFSTVDIDGGTIDGTTIGATSASTGAFTTLSSTSTTTLNGTTIPASKTLVTTVDTQTLTNKTLTAPVISTISNTGTLTLPTSTDTLVGRATTDTLTNKTLTSPTITGTGTAAFGNLSYTGTLTGSTGILNIGSGQIYKDASGNVGIGTTSPSAKLDLVSSTTLVSMAVEGNGTNFAGLLSGGIEPTVFYKSTSSLRFGTATDKVGGGYTERMRITSAGNVGIGTTAPLARFEVAGDSSTAYSTSKSIETRGAITVRNPSNTAGTFSSIDIQAGTNAAASASISVINDAGTSNTNSTLTFALRDSTTNVIERMRITSTGNVGIGTAAPVARLNVSHADASIPDVIFTNTVASSSAGGAVLILQNIDGAANASGDRLATLIFRGAGDASNTVVTGARISAFAEANFTASSSPTNLRFETTPTGSTATSERMRITSAGNVGIGTSSPTERLSLTDGAFTIVSGGVTSLFAHASSTAFYGTTSNHPVRFATNNTERARIDASGNLLVGKTGLTDTGAGFALAGTGAAETGLVYFARSGGLVMSLNRITNTGEVVRFASSGTVVGTISVTGSATSYNTSSDQRLKENITDAPSASESIDAIQIRSFDWKADGSHQKYGVIAQELEAIAPEAVSKGDKEDDMWGVDYSKLVPMMVKAMQEQQAQIEQLRAEIETLKGE
jgi:hypothetical protein